MLVKFDVKGYPVWAIFLLILPILALINAALYAGLLYVAVKIIHAAWG